MQITCIPLCMSTALEILITNCQGNIIHVPIPNCTWICIKYTFMNLKKQEEGENIVQSWQYMKSDISHGNASALLIRSWKFPDGLIRTNNYWTEVHNILHLLRQKEKYEQHTKIVPCFCQHQTATNDKSTQFGTLI